MWRSRMFWQLFGCFGGLYLSMVLLLAILLLRHAHHLSAPSAQLEELRLRVWLSAGAAALLGLAATYWIIRRFVRPLQELTASAAQIAAGDYERKIYFDAQDEVGILARTFNRTGERLATQLEQIAQDRLQLTAVLSSMVEGVIAVDAGQRVLFVTERASHLLELPAQNVVGRPLWEVVRHRQLQEMVNAALATAEPHHQELDWLSPSPRNLTIHAGPLPGKPPRGVVLVVHDTTELRRLEKLRQEFVANVSHELKTPLTVIKAHVETLLDGAVEDCEVRGQFLEGIAEQAERLHSLIHDLLSLSRIESGAETFTRDRVALAEIVQHSVQARAALAESRRQTLEMAPPESGAAVVAWADEEAVQQILGNLVDNALKYTPEGGRIRVRWWQEADRACFAVEDNGMGISDRDLPRIFERFYRVDKARSRELGGTGLGLSIVKHLTQAMQGSVHAGSKLQEGSVFTIKLPLPPG